MGSGRRRMAAVVIVALVGLLPACGDSSGGPELTVMTRNLYLGADLTTVLDPAPGASLLELIDQTWEAVLASDYPARVEALADEIADGDVDVVGLQEVMRYELAGTEPLELDFLDLLIAALADRDLTYEVVVEQDQFGGPFPTSAGLVTLRDRDAIIARVGDGLTVEDTDSGQFDAALEVPNPLGGTIRILRGWTAADLTLDGTELRVVNTHLEAFGEEVRTEQAAELLAGPAAGDVPTIVLGDLNSDAPDGAAYRLVLDEGGFADAWDEAGEGDGLTCCWAGDLRSAGELDSRIDLVLHRGGFEASAVEVVGDEESDRVTTEAEPASLLWPSDHAGVVATLDLPDAA